LLPQELKAAEGMKHLLKFLELRPQDPDALYMLGRCLDASGETGNAALIYQRVLEIKPDYRLAQIALTDLKKSA
jgi:tetratricopeptide (TPR) repeat protein